MPTISTRTDSPEALLENWRRILLALQKCNPNLSPSITIICLHSTTILGWIWTEGHLSASSHRIATLSSCPPPPPGTVRGLWSFIGVYNVLGRVLPKMYSHMIAHWRVPLQVNSPKSAYSGQIRYANSSVLHKPTSLHGNPSPYHDHLINFGSLLTDQLSYTVSGPPYTSPTTRSFISLASLAQNFENIKSPGYHVKLKLPHCCRS